MKRKMVLLLAALMIALFAAGCGGNQDSGSTSEQTQSAADKEMVVGIPKVTDSFDYYNTANGFESISMLQVYDTLVIKDSDGKTVPSLAEKYEISPDGKTITFYLRKRR